jgi:hypothetical protein
MSVVLQACAAHLQLAAPAANAPGERRVEAYDELRPIDYRLTHTTSAYGSYTDVDFVQLNNGVKVESAEDLLPLVPANSGAATSMRGVISSRQKNHWFALGGVAGFLTGAIVTVAGLAGDSSTLRYGGAGLLGGALVCVSFTNYYAKQTNALTEQAYKQYDDALRRRLDVCKDGERIVPCP